MLSPRKSQVILLPEDRKLIDLLGWDEDQYRYFVRQASTHNDIRPGEPTAFLVVPFLVKLVIGLALSYAASLLSRRSNAPGARIETRNVDGQNIVSGGRFAPRAGFNSTQNVVELGSVIPIVFAKREQIGGVWYGGVRINTNLLWSQLYSQGTSQLLRALFMVSEGPIGALDPRQFAIGDNLLGAYDLETTGNTSGRASIYFRAGGGLITSADHIAGRLPAYDDGNAENSGGSSVFDVRGINQGYNNDFCYVSRPSNQREFGVYSLIGNNLSYRVNPQLRPISNPQLRPKGDQGNSRVTCVIDAQGAADRMKYRAIFTGRSGIIKHNSAFSSDGQRISLSVGDTFTYRMYSSSDYNRNFLYVLGVAKCIDVAQAIASRQRQWDDAIVVGELYKFGGCYAICTSRNPSDAVFVSEAENEPRGGGKNIDAVFRVVRAGDALFSDINAITNRGEDSNPIRNASNFSHLYRASVSSFVIDRPTQVIEIGYKSTLGIRISGMMNYRDSEKASLIDAFSCDFYEGTTVGKSGTLQTTNITTGSVSLSEVRYSFFRIAFRIAGSDDAPVEMNINFGVASQTQQPAYNYLRVQFPTAQRWEVTHYPLTAWEIRSDYYSDPLILLDSRYASSAKTASSNGFVVNYSGKGISRSASTFKLSPTISKNGDLGIGSRDSGSYADAWGALAEAFILEEIQSSAAQLEHEIAYVNLIGSNPTPPTYANISTVGLTLRSGPGLSQLDQFSVYVNCGYGATHLFPEALAIMLTNQVFGTGSIVSPAQIDFDSFLYCANWTNNRRYFFDIGISDPSNLRSKGAEWAKQFLLDLSTKNGKFHLSPIAEFGVQYSPTALFTSGNSNAVTVSERDSQERQPIRVSVKWREERQANDLSGRGLFPVIRELTVREAGVSETAPLVQIDLSEFCTSELHALDVGKMRCREQRLVTHDVNLECLPDRAAVEPGAIVKIGMELLAYEQPNNGVILADGATTTTSGTSLTDGVYNVILWRGLGDALEEVAITVVDGKVSGYSNCVFCIADSVQTTQTFKLQVISYDEDGNLEITASYYPLDENGYSLLVEDWDSPGAWVVEGLIGELPPDTALSPTFDGVAINGSVSGAVNDTYIYLGEISGPTDSYIYTWSGSGVTFDDTTSAEPVITLTSTGTAELNLTVTRTSDAFTRNTSLTIDVGLNTVNGVTISGPNSIIGSGTVVLTAVSSAPFVTASYVWSIVGEGTISGELTDTLTITLDGEDLSTRQVNVLATIDGIEYENFHLVSVFELDPIVIAGPTSVGVGSSDYDVTLSEELGPPELWAFSWTIDPA